MKKINPLYALTAISALLGLYQINLVAQKLTQYGLENNISYHLSWGMTLQQKIEESKISFKSGMEKNMITEPIAPITPITISARVAEKNVAINLSAPPVNLSQNNIDKNNVPNNIASTTPEASCLRQCIILTIGDSMMGDIFYSMNRQLKKRHPDWKIVNAHKVSSGLSKEDYYHWPKVASKLMAEVKPHYIVVLLGMNDAQGIIDAGKTAPFNTSAWKEVYSRRTQELYDLIGKNAVWIELPHVKVASFDARLSQVRNIHRDIAGKDFLPVTPLIGDNQSGQFSKYRQGDGIHLNALASDAIAELIYQRIETQ